jgi:hypothetical protein
MPTDPKEIGKKILDGLSSPIISSLENRGITVDYLAGKLQEELEADETKSFQYKGAVIESKKKTAWEIRQRARIDAHKIRGDYPSEKHHHTFEGGVPVVPLTEEEQKRFEEWKQFEKHETMKKAMEGDS